MDTEKKEIESETKVEGPVAEIDESEVKDVEPTHSSEDLEITDQVFEFVKKVSSPILVLRVLKYVFSIQSIRPFLYKTKEYLQENKSIPSEWVMPNELSNLGALSQHKALAFLQESKLWKAYVAHIGCTDDGVLSSEVKNLVLDFVRSGGTFVVQEEAQGIESVRKRESYPWNEVDEEQKRQIQMSTRRRARRNRRKVNRVEADLPSKPLYYIQIDNSGVPYISLAVPTKAIYN